MMDFSNKEDFLGRWINNQLSEEERKAFEASEDFALYQKILENSSHLKAPDYDIEKQLEELKQHNQRKTKSIVRTLAPILSTVAAAAVLIFFIFFRSDSQVVNAGYGEVAETMLPDGTEVYLNANTTIKYSPKDWENNRQVALEGEAFFKVKKGSIFTVQTTLGEVAVLGTSFNVYTRDDLFEVKCYEGKVRTSGIEEVYLTAGKSYREVGGTVEPFEFNLIEEPNWMNNESSFNNSPIRQVLIALSSQYELEFKGNLPSDSLRMTVSFPNDNEQLALEIVFKSLGKKYSKSSEGVILIE